MSMKVPDCVTSVDFNFDSAIEQIKPISSLLMKVQSGTNKKSNRNFKSHICYIHSNVTLKTVQ